MIKIVLTGLWISLVTLGSLYGATVWKAGEEVKIEPKKFFGSLDTVKTEVISVPIIHEGVVKGYVLARFVYLADANLLKKLSVPPDVILMDEAFRTIYSGRLRDFERIEKYDLAALTRRMKDNANKRFEADIIKDVLVDSINYVSKSEIRFRGLRQ